MIATAKDLRAAVLDRRNVWFSPGLAPHHTDIYQVRISGQSNPYTMLPGYDDEWFEPDDYELCREEFQGLRKSARPITGERHKELLLKIFVR